MLKTQTNARWIDFFRLCWWRAPVSAGSLVFYNHTWSLWSLLSHYLVDVVYLLVQHCHGRQLSLNAEPQSLGQRGRFRLLLCCPREWFKVLPVRTVTAGWHYRFCLDFLLLSRGSRSGLPQTSVGLSFIVVLSSVYPPAFKPVADPVGLRTWAAEERRWSSQRLFNFQYILFLEGVLRVNVILVHK